MTEEFKSEVVEALRILIALRHPDIEEKNFRRCNLIDLYNERGGETGGWLSPSEFAELNVLQKDCQNWLDQNGYQDFSFRNLSYIPIAIKSGDHIPAPPEECSS